jgi:hypothetical protein
MLNMACQQAAAAASDSEDINHESDGFHGPPSPSASPEPLAGVEGGEDVRIHPIINGT